MGVSHSTPLRGRQWPTEHYLPPVQPRREPSHPAFPDTTDDVDDEVTVTEDHPPDPEALPPSLIDDAEPPAAPTLPPTQAGQEPPPFELDVPDPFHEFRPNPVEQATERELRQLEDEFLDARPYKEPTFEELCDKFDQSFDPAAEKNPFAEPDEMPKPEAVVEATTTKSTDSDEWETSPDDVVFEPVKKLDPSWRDKKKPTRKIERRAVRERRAMIRNGFKEIDRYLHEPSKLATRLDAVAKFQSGLPTLVEMLNQTVKAIAQLDTEYQKLIHDPPKTADTVKRIDEMIAEASGIWETMDEQSTRDEYAKLISEINGSNKHITWLAKATEMYEDVREYYAQRRIIWSKKMNAEMIVYENRLSEVEEAFAGSSLPGMVNIGRTERPNEKNPEILAQLLQNQIFHFRKLKSRISYAIRLREEEETGDLFYAKV